MDLPKRFVDEAVKNARLVNLDLDEPARNDAFREAAAHMRVLAAMATLSPPAKNVMRVMMAHEDLWRDEHAFLTAAAAAMSLSPADVADPEEVALFVRMADGRRDAVP